MTVNNFLNASIKLMVFFVALRMVFFPENVGQWLAEMGVAYDLTWMEYVADCDCMESLE